MKGNLFILLAYPAMQIIEHGQTMLSYIRLMEFN